MNIIQTPTPDVIINETIQANLDMFQNVMEIQEGIEEMQTRMITNSETYTLQEARKIIKREEKRKLNLLKYFLAQKAIGLVLIAISVIMPLLFDGDATVSVFMLPFGLWLVITNKRVLSMLGMESELR